MYNKYAEIEEKLRKATPEQRAGYIAKLQSMRERDQQKYDDAVKFRPHYAPAGRMTREESGTKVVLQETTELLDHVTKFCKTLVEMA